MSNHSNRRKFLGTTAGAAVFTILPRRLLARSPEVPPSDKITLAYIGTGTQGLRELLPLLAARLPAQGDPPRAQQARLARRHGRHHPRRPRCCTEHRRYVLR